MASAATMGPVERVTNAMNILKLVRASDLKIEKNVLYTPLYSGTALARKNSSTDDTYGTDEVVRKNIYYLAEQIKNVKKLLIQLIQRGFLNLSERENIVKHDDPFLMSVEMLTILVKKDSSRYNLFLDILQETGNSDMADLLKTAILPENLGQNNVAGAGAGAVTQTPERKMRPIVPPGPVTPISIVEPWFCRHCTFKNDVGRICSMCSKSNGFDQATLPKSPRAATTGASAFFGFGLLGDFFGESNTHFCGTLILWEYVVILPKLRSLEIPSFKFKADYGIPAKRVNAQLIRNLLRLCETRVPSSTGQRVIGGEEEFRVSLERHNFGVQFNMGVRATIMSKTLLPPATTDSSVTLNKKVANILPFNSIANFEETNIYEDGDFMAYKEDSPFPFIQTAFVSHHIPGAHTHIHPRWNNDRFSWTSILFNFASALLMVRRKYGNDVKELPEPIITQRVHFTGKEINRFTTTSTHLISWNIFPLKEKQTLRKKLVNIKRLELCQILLT